MKLLVDREIKSTLPVTHNRMESWRCNGEVNSLIDSKRLSHDIECLPSRAIPKFESCERCLAFSDER